MSDNNSTRILLDRFRAGDDAALHELYARHAPNVLAIVKARLGPELRKKLESGDVVQDALLASLRTIDDFQYSSEGAFLKWLGQIVENRIRDQIDHYRAARRDHRKEIFIENLRSPDSSAPLEISDSSANASPSQALSLQEDIAKLFDALDGLSEERRELIIAVQLEGRSFQELAEEFRETPDAVRMRFNRAMDSLAQVVHRLDQQGGHQGGGK